MSKDNPTLSGKDFCNCDHAQMFYKAIEEASAVLAEPITPGGLEGKVQNVEDIFEQALAAHDEAEADYKELG